MFQSSSDKTTVLIGAQDRDRCIFFIVFPTDFIDDLYSDDREANLHVVERSCIWQSRINLNSQTPPSPRSASSHRPTRSAARCNPHTENRSLGLNSNRDIALTDRVTVHRRNRRERIPAV